MKYLVISVFFASALSSQGQQVSLGNNSPNIEHVSGNVTITYTYTCAVEGQYNRWGASASGYGGIGSSYPSLALSAAAPSLPLRDSNSTSGGSLLAGSGTDYSFTLSSKGLGITPLSGVIAVTDGIGYALSGAKDAVDVIGRYAPSSNGMMLFETVRGMSSASVTVATTYASEFVSEADPHPTGTVLDGALSDNAALKWASLTKPAGNPDLNTGTVLSAGPAEYLSRLLSLASAVQSNTTSPILGSTLGDVALSGPLSVRPAESPVLNVGATQYLSLTPSLAGPVQSNTTGPILENTLGDVARSGPLSVRPAESPALNLGATQYLSLTPSLAGPVQSNTTSPILGNTLGDVALSGPLPVRNAESPVLNLGAAQYLSLTPSLAGLAESHTSSTILDNTSSEVALNRPSLFSPAEHSALNADATDKAPGFLSVRDLHRTSTILDSTPSGKAAFEWASVTEPARNPDLDTGTSSSTGPAEHLSRFLTLAGVVEGRTPSPILDSALSVRTALQWSAPVTAAAGSSAIITGTDYVSLSKSLADLTAHGKTITGWAVAYLAGDER